MHALFIPEVLAFPKMPSGPLFTAPWVNSLALGRELPFMRCCLPCLDLHPPTGRHLDDLETSQLLGRPSSSCQLRSLTLLSDSVASSHSSLKSEMGTGVILDQPAPQAPPPAPQVCSQWHSHFLPGSRRTSGGISLPCLTSCLFSSLPSRYKPDPVTSAQPPSSPALLPGIVSCHHRPCPYLLEP